MLPYRDVICHNLPGHIYIHWLLGTIFGWGKTVPFLLLCIARHRFRHHALAVGQVPIWVVPARHRGVRRVSHNISRFRLGQVAQRDWHAALFAVTGLTVLEWNRGVASRLAAAFAMAVCS